MAALTPSIAPVVNSVTVCAQENKAVTFPNHPTRIAVPFPAGGPAERLIG